MPGPDVQRFDLQLLERHVELAAENRVLELGYHDPAAALWAAGQGCRVLALRPAVDLAAALGAQAAALDHGRLEVRVATAPAPEEAGAFDVVLLLAPFFLGNAPANDAIHAAAAALHPSGRLYAQLHRRHGGDTFVRTMRRCFGTVELLGIGRGQRRLYRAAGPHPAETPAERAPGGDHSITARGAAIELRTAAGIFASRGLDPGSRLLLDTVEPPPGARILDLGCGAGAIGLALAAADPTASVTLTDVSHPAVELAAENARRNRLTNADVRLGDGYACVCGERFDTIVANLPAHRGHVADRDTAKRFIAGAADHLARGGVAWFVTARTNAYEPAAAHVFLQVHQAATSKGYKVLRCAEPRTPSSRVHPVS